MSEVPTHFVPSGMGGVWDGDLTGKEKLINGVKWIEFRILNTQHPDMHGRKFWYRETDATKIEKE